MLYILSTCLAYSLISTTSALSLNVSTSIAPTSNGTDIQANPPHPPGFTPSSCQASRGPNPWSWTSFTTAFSPPANSSATEDQNTPYSALPAGCRKLAGANFPDDPLLGTIKTPYMIIPADASNEYYFSWTLSKKAIAAIWVREEDARTWTELHTFMMTAAYPASFKLTFPRKTQLTIDVNFQSSAGEVGTTGLIALFRIPKRTVGDGEGNVDEIASD